MQNVKSCMTVLKILVALVSTLTPNSSTSSSCKQEPYTMKHVFKKKSKGGKSQLKVRKEKDEDRKKRNETFNQVKTPHNSDTLFSMEYRDKTCYNTQ